MRCWDIVKVDPIDPAKHSWEAFLRNVESLRYLYTVVNYTPYKITFKKGIFKAIDKEIELAAKYALQDCDSQQFGFFLPLLELPRIFFYGGGIGNDFHPHLHAIIWFPAGKIRYLLNHLKATCESGNSKSSSLEGNLQYWIVRLHISKNERKRSLAKTETISYIPKDK